MAPSLREQSLIEMFILNLFFKPILNIKRRKVNYTHTKKNRSNKFQTATNTLKMDDNTERHDALIVLSPLYALSYKTTDFILLSSSSSINPMYPNAMDKQLQQQQA